ncbi:formimidoylglutamate deiminase [Caballeronia sp. LZ035]|uniref:formimidoylglutamate deiminase n=1 Tax=Caballeronia sp. LZ035 TaxID=3038568 RepID=UPI002858B4F0|nr:formimidoylglutamate deiminase [Caballeronia sp. LZ035]MDR5760899.1 formimidoylglutamate deiminase [Caballeronia sp. LZ035]
MNSSTSSNSSLFAAHALLPDGWRTNVLLEWNDAGTLVAVTPDMREVPANAARAAGPVAPGMPNLHSHAFQRAMAGLTEYRANPADSFWSWRDLMYRFALRITPDTLGAIARWLYVEMLKAGYTSVCEFHYVHHAEDGAHYAHPAELALRVVDAASETGIGMTMLPVLYQYGGFDEQPPRADQRRFINATEDYLDLLSGLRTARPEHGALRYGVAPHSLRAVSKASLRALLDGLDAMSPGSPVHIHIAEQTAEVDASLAALGARPVQWLLDHFDVNARWCLVHATHVDAGETLALARSGAITGLCLTTEANLGDGFFPVAEYLDAQGAFGVGSDSHIGVDWRAELRLLEYGQRLQRRQRNVLASLSTAQVADRLFHGALEGGARATGRATGKLEAGARADWLVLDADHPNLAEQTPATWLSSVVFCEHGETPVRDVFVGGECVVRERRHRDEARHYADYRRALSQLLADA